MRKFASKWKLVLASGAFALLGAGTASATAISTFDTNADGWTCFGDCTSFTYVAAGGNPGGFIRASDQAQGILWYFQASSAFLGNQSGAYGTNLTFNLQDSASGPTTDGPGVWIGDGALSLVYDMTPPDPANAPNWSSYSVTLLASAGWKVGTIGGVAATEAQLQQVLGSMDFLRIRGEYISGADTGGLDNVKLMTVAEPGSVAILALGLGLLGWASRRRKSA